MTEEKRRKLEQELDRKAAPVKGNKLREYEAMLDETARLWKMTPQEGNEGLIRKYYNDIFLLVFRLYDREPVAGSQEFNPEAHYYDPDALLTALLQTMERFDPEKGKFTHYFSRRFSGRKKDSYEHFQAKDPLGTSLETPAAGPGGDGKELTLGDTLSAAESQTPEHQMRSDGLLAELTALVLNCAGNMGNSSQRRMWYRLFYTEDMTFAMKTYEPRFLHERDVFMAMDLEYLDYYMSARCRTGNAVNLTPLKPYEDVVPGRTGTIPLPLPANVSLAFLAACRGMQVGAPARSNQIGFYEKDKAVIYKQAD